MYLIVCRETVDAKEYSRDFPPRSQGKSRLSPRLVRAEFRVVA